MLKLKLFFDKIPFKDKIQYVLEELVWLNGLSYITFFETINIAGEYFCHLAICNMCDYTILSLQCKDIFNWKMVKMLV